MALIFIIEDVRQVGPGDGRRRALLCISFGRRGRQFVLNPHFLRGMIALQHPQDADGPLLGAEEVGVRLVERW